MANILSEILNSARSTGIFTPAAQQGQKLSYIRDQAKRAEDAQRLSNLGQAAATGLNIINQDPQNAQANLENYIAQRKAVLPASGFTNMEDTEALEKALREGGVPAAQQLLSGALNAAQSAGFKLPPPTTPDLEQTFTAIGPSGKPEIFFRSNQGAVPTGLLAPEKTPLVQVGAGGGEKERTQRFGQLFDESKNVDRALGQFNQVRDIVAEGGLGTVGTSGEVTRGLEKAASAIGGFVRNLGIVDVGDEETVLAGALKGSQLEQAANTNAKVRSLITNLAFAVAQAQNPGGRITDKDFAAAVQTIGANADNPEQLTTVINQFGTNLLNQFETDVEREGAAFGFTPGQFKSLRNIPSRQKFMKGAQPKRQQQQTTRQQGGITATTRPEDLTREQAQELAKNNPDLLRQIIANAKRGQ